MTAVIDTVFTLETIQGITLAGNDTDEDRTVFTHEAVHYYATPLHEQPIYNRQETIQDELSIPDNVIIVGCGGVGTWVAIALAMGGTQRFILIDHDNIEEHNLNRLPYPQSSIGRNKAEALKEYIINIRPGAYVVAIDQRVEDVIGLLDFTNQTVYCCTDTMASRLAAWNACANVRKQNYQNYYGQILYRRIGLDGFGLTFSTKKPPEWGDGIDNGYQITPSWAGGCFIAGALATMRRTWESTRNADYTIDLTGLA
jgi:hypothetical protein